MIVIVGTGTFFRMLYSLGLVAIRLTLFIYCDWDGLDKKNKKKPFSGTVAKDLLYLFPLAFRSPFKLRIAMEPILSLRILYNPWNIYAPRIPLAKSLMCSSN